jgi:hypothetical protein
VEISEQEEEKQEVVKNELLSREHPAATESL